MQPATPQSHVFHAQDATPARTARPSGTGLRHLPALHGLLMDQFSKREEVLGFRTSVIYDYIRQPLLDLPPTE